MRGRGSASPRGGRGGNFGGRGGGGGGRGGGRGGFHGRDDRPRSENIEAGIFVRKSNGTGVFKLSTSNGNVPLTQTYLFDSHNNQVGKIQDVFGPLDDVYFNLAPEDPKYLDTLKEGDKIFCPSDRCHEEAFYINDQPTKRGGRGGGRGGQRGGGGGGRGGRGSFGGRGGNRGGGRGRF